MLAGSFALVLYWVKNENLISMANLHKKLEL